MVSDSTLAELLGELRRSDYQFAVVTPTTHARNLRRPADGPATLRDIFGWNRPFEACDLDPALLAILHEAELIDANGPLLRSRVRVASFADSLFLHSAFPTEGHDSVFFGPDTYRFGNFVARHARDLGPQWLVEMGCGSGAVGIATARSFAPVRLSLVDINPAALLFAAVNAKHAGVPAETIFDRSIPAGADLVIANPPYMIDAAGRAYRNGGALLGGAVALDWTEQSLDKMAPGGTLILYAGASYEDGRAPLLDALRGVCAGRRATLAVEELDPDVFGEEIGDGAYARVERIAAFGAVVTKTG